MLPHVKILYRTICAQAEYPLVILRDPRGVEQIRAEVRDLMEQLGMSYLRIQRDRLETADWRLTFVSGSDFDGLCGVRADLLFARLSEWTEQQVNEELRPLLAGSVSLQRYRLERTLIKRGLMTNEERHPNKLTMDDVLVNLD